MIGTTLSHYKILDELGRGGMGIVYKATDTKLNRTVALKVLPAAALASEDDRARFFREAQAAAQLTHAHIATVYEIDEAILKDADGKEQNASDGPRPFIAMEYIEGETLEARIEKGPLKLEEAVRLALETADALKAAHAKNIVHRDIKSANVMMTAEGKAKVLDFGLAKTTHSTMLTRMGSTLGTVAFMSPEQARGEEVDSRTDLYSLGTMLYEMVAGRRPFAGEYEQAVVYAILNEAPEPLTALRSGVPMNLEWIVNKCLAKKADDRYQTASDLMVDLRNLDLKASGVSRISTVSAASMASGFIPASAPTLVQPPAKRILLPSIGVAAVALILGVVAGYLVFRTQPQPQPLVRVTIDLPGVSGAIFPTMSPTKEFLAFYGFSENGGSGLYLRDMGSGEIRFVSDADVGNSREIVFSPSGTRLAFTDGGNGGVYTVVVPAGLPEQHVERGRMAFWEDENTFIFVDDVPGGETYRKTIGTKEPELITLNQDELAQGYVTLWKTLIPGSGVAFGHRLNRGGDVQGATSWLIRAFLEDGESVIQVESPIMNPEFVKGGFLAYQQRNDTGTLVVRPVDSRTGEFTGPPKEALENDATTWRLFSVSADGDLLYRPAEQGNTNVSPRPFLIDLESKTTTGVPMVVPTESRVRWPVFSPNGSLLAITIGLPGADDNLVLYDVAEQTLTQITFGVDAASPSWSSDGDWIYYSVETADSVNVYRQHPAASSTPELVVRDAWMGDVSPDSRFVAFVRDNRSIQGTWLMLLDLESMDVAVVDSSRGYIDEVRFSPDGAYVAYADFFTGLPEVRVAAVDGFRVSEIPDVVGSPRWSRDGQSLFVLGRVGLRIPVRTAPSFTMLGAPEQIYFASLPLWGSALSPDGESVFIVARDISFAASASSELQGSQFIWLQHWSDHLKRVFAR